MMKWVFDRTAAFVGLAVLWPFMLIIAVVMKCFEPGFPILFHQQRVGRNGKLFTIHKFRTMRPNSGRSTVSVAGDNRITYMGAFLRRYKLDELPELWNVFVGEMSFVGPRPDVPGYADRLHGEERLILRLRPGITGPATIKYRNEEYLLAGIENPEEYNDTVIWRDKVKINMEYNRNRTFLGDLKIIFVTLGILK